MRFIKRQAQLPSVLVFFSDFTLPKRNDWKRYSKKSQGNIKKMIVIALKIFQPFFADSFDFDKEQPLCTIVM